MTLRSIWIEGQPAAVRDQAVPVTDRGLLYGQGLFETVRVVNGRGFRLEAHLARMEASARALGMPLPPSGWQRRAAAALEEAASTLEAGAGRARLTFTAGEAARDADPAAEAGGSPRLFLTLAPLDLAPARGSGAAGVTALVAGPPAPGHPGALTTHKTLGWLGNLLCLRAARSAGADEGLVATADGRIVGGARGNLFLVLDGALVTPGRSSGPLPGITRGIVLEEIAPALGLSAVERDLAAEDLARAEEAFLTGSLQGVLAIGRLPGWAGSRPAPGRLTARLAEAYIEVMALECGRRMLDFRPSEDSPGGKE